MQFDPTVSLGILINLLAFLATIYVIRRSNLKSFTDSYEKKHEELREEFKNKHAENVKYRENLEARVIKLETHVSVLEEKLVAISQDIKEVRELIIKFLLKEAKQNG